MTARLPTLALTQGDPAGIGPEIIAKLLAGYEAVSAWKPLVVAERAALEAQSGEVFEPIRDRIEYLTDISSVADLELLEGDRIAVLDPVKVSRVVRPGHSGSADAAGAIAAIDMAVDLVQAGLADALVTAPISKKSIAEHHLPDFRGHTDYLAMKAGLTEYGRDHLMAFLAPDLQVALLTTHLPLATALAEIDTDRIIAALRVLQRVAGGRIAVAGINPHAGEAGLLGSEDKMIVGPAVEAARKAGINAYGPESADSLFARARQGEFDWVLALYHDQGLIAVKTAWFGKATNWTLGLPFLRTSVDHGTAFDLAGRNAADAEPLEVVIASTLRLLSGDLPRARPGSPETTSSPEMRDRE